MMMIITVKKTLWFVTLVMLFSATQAADFAGPKKCRGCHKDEYTEWKDSPHALAFSGETFQQTWKDLGGDYSCLDCHATGTDPQAETYSHPGVTCESCHGIMSKGHNKKDAEMPLPITSEVCRDCHKRTYQEWQLSQHSQNDIRCFDCHGVHAQSLRSNGGDLLCGACHSRRLEAFAHATHQLEGLHCNTCHMPVSANPVDVIEGAGAAGHTLFVGTEVCGHCHADMIHSSSLLPEMREQLVVMTQNEYRTNGKGPVELYEEVQTLTWMLDSARYKLWTVSVLGLVVGLLLGWMFGWYVFEKKRQK
jgi:hypothetical protein